MSTAAPAAERPLVSCVIAAYNGERFLERTLDSVLAQDYPADRLEIVVVDDGSTDTTGTILDRYAAARPDRFAVIHQPNAGAMAATERGIRAARGELIAMIDQDDLWLPHKISTQVDHLRDRPEVGLLYSDMRVIDESGDVIRDSLHGLYAYGEHPVRGRLRGTLMGGCVCVGPSIIFRASLADSVLPMAPRELFAYPDYWIAFAISARAELDFVDEPLALYRRHGFNVSAGIMDTPAHQVEDGYRQVRARRTMLTLLQPGEVTAAELEGALEGLEYFVASVRHHAGTGLLTVADVTDADRLAAGLELLLARDDAFPFEERLCAAMRAVGHDPTDDEIRRVADDLIGQAHDAGTPDRPVTAGPGVSAVRAPAPAPALFDPTRHTPLDIGMRDPHQLFDYTDAHNRPRPLAAEPAAIFGGDRWQTSFGERAAFIGVLASLRPKLALEVGTAQGGSLRHIAQWSDHVLSVDILDGVPDREALTNVDFHIGDSHVILPDVLAEIAAAGKTLDFALIDGDHSAEGVCADLRHVLRSPACANTLILLHDPRNDEVRRGIEAAEPASCDHVVYYEPDFVAGYTYTSGDFAGQHWGGFALIVTGPQRLPGYAADPRQRKYVERFGGAEGDEVKHLRTQVEAARGAFDAIAHAVAALRS